jgi:cellulose synthase/poly-beta-1,6-N-acetylglucosamine synthase-like glycosyltransferase
MVLLSWTAFLLWLIAAAVLGRGMLRLGSLDDVAPAADPDCPPLSIVVAARNEAATIEPAMRSLLSLDYPDLEVIAVNDRSTDGTGALLEQLAASNRRLRVIHVEALPPGWLGKNHALQRGSEAARGEWILFTDADVLFAPDALRRAVAWVAERPAAAVPGARCQVPGRKGPVSLPGTRHLAPGTGSEATISHLVAMPRVLLEGFWERLFVSYFSVLFNMRYRPWRASDPRSRSYLGVGAFNLVRAGAYRAVGGHAALPLEVADDVKLGKWLKRHGQRTAVVAAGDRVRVRWVVGLRGVVDGLTKNTFAGLEFRWGAVATTALVLLLGHVGPALYLLDGAAARAAALGTLACMVGAAAAVRSGTRVPAAYGLAYPLAAAVMLYILLRSAILAEWRGAVEWRGPRYSLDELRKGVV